ncbi:MAG: hypothetical protein ABMA00_05415 [Gemmatimonas sp.]
MTIRLAAAALFFSAATASAQQPPVSMDKMDHSKMGQEKMHAMSPWKELDAYHMLMMATWHPAKDKGDMAPTRAKIGDMVASAKALAASTAPKGCDSPKLKATAAALPTQTQGVADLVAKKAEDGALKDALKALHDSFDVLEAGCTMPKKDGAK